MIYTHVLFDKDRPVRSPLDTLSDNTEGTEEPQLLWRDFLYTQTLAVCHRLTLG